MASSKIKAQALIMSGRVTVNGAQVIKAGSIVKTGDQVELLNGPKFVSRGGDKLEGALVHFQIESKDKICLDVGSSTGGFTDCLLKGGAKKVFSVDVGKGQLDQSLRNDSRVEVFENTHILNFKKAEFQDFKINLVVIDVSFISLGKIIPYVYDLIETGCEVLPMIKPQFEVGPKFLDKGVVRSQELQIQVVEKIIKISKETGFDCLGDVKSTLKGPKGNQEYFLHLVKK